MLYFNCIVAVIWLLESLPRGAVMWTAVYDCDISWSYSLTFVFESATSVSVDTLSLLYSDFTSSFLLAPSQAKRTKCTRHRALKTSFVDLFNLNLSLPYCRVVTCWERADFLAILYVIVYCVFVPFVYGDLGQVWYLIVSILDLCLFFTIRILGS